MDERLKRFPCGHRQVHTLLYNLSSLNGRIRSLCVSAFLCKILQYFPRNELRGRSAAARDRGLLLVGAQCRTISVSATT